MMQEGNVANKESKPPERIIDSAERHKPKVRVVKVPFDLNPLEKNQCFQLMGAIFQVFQAKTRGRVILRYLGEPGGEPQDGQKVKVVKKPERFCPLTPGDFFELLGAVFHVYEVKSRGRILIRFLGMPETGKG